MKRSFSSTLELDILQTTQRVVADAGIVNIPVLADEIRRRNEADNIALEDIEYEVLLLAQRLGLAIEFDRGASGVVIPAAGGALPEAVLNAPIRD